jgi:sulfur relay (sulfurtransferase) DsrC/TusE family protein
MAYKVKQVKEGIKVEREHKSTVSFIKKYSQKHGRMPSENEIFKRIAKNHLDENPFYYKKLKKCKL